MKRLTTDDKNSIVFSFNTFYAKDREIWIRGGGPAPDYQDVTLVQWIRSAASKHGLSITADDPEYLGEEMYDALQDGDETVEGILAIMHLAAVQATEMRERLKPIEEILGDDYNLDRLRELIEADRDGKLLVWPSEKVYVTDVANGKITEQDVCSVHLHKDQNNSAIVTGYSVEERNVSDVYRTKRRKFSQLGKTVFFTMDAANAALKGMVE